LGGWPQAKGHPPEQFWRTLVANRGKDGKNPPVYYSRACEDSFKKGGFHYAPVSQQENASRLSRGSQYWREGVKVAPCAYLDHIKQTANR
jgi:hypothetical protein